MKENLKIILISLFIALVILSLFGGFAYMFFPREQNNSILSSCFDLGGQGQWLESTGKCRGPNGWVKGFPFISENYITASYF